MFRPHYGSLQWQYAYQPQIHRWQIKMMCGLTVSTLPGSQFCAADALCMRGVSSLMSISYTWGKMPSSRLSEWSWVLMCQVSKVHLCQNEGITAFIWVLVQLMVCLVLTACSAIANLSGRADLWGLTCALELIEQVIFLSVLHRWLNNPGIQYGIPHQSSSPWEHGPWKLGSAWCQGGQDSPDGFRVPLTYGMVTVALGLFSCLDWFLVEVLLPCLSHLG